jgi:hydrogenase expression/formation protein HypD
VHIMEICGGHTHSIFRYGLDKLIHEGVEFIHGPGCPVCVLPMARVDECVQLAELPGVIFCTFGDAMRVPGHKKSLLQAKAAGADIRMVYSPLDALELARRNPKREVIFFGLGFETTTPSTALSIQQAAREKLENFSIFCNHITVPEPIKALLDDPDMLLDGFIGPGHVSMVIGVHPYDFIARDYHKPIVVAGFEPVDLLQSVLMVLTQISEQRAEVENQYARVVPEHGNPVSIAAIADVYERRPSFEWRGLGEIDASGLRIRAAYSAYDAEEKFGIGYAAGPRNVPEIEGCACGAVMTGRIKPTACPQFGVGCTPEMPLGALMVSSEGACAAYWQYGGARAVAAL